MPHKDNFDMMTARYQINEHTAIRSAMHNQKPGESFDVITESGRNMKVSTLPDAADLDSSDVGESASGPEIKITGDNLVPLGELPPGSFVEVNSEACLVGRRSESAFGGYSLIFLKRLSDGRKRILRSNDSVRPLTLVSAEFTR